MQNLFKLTALATALSLVGCGGGSGQSATGTDYVAAGTISGFGSVMVGGVKYETDNTDFQVDRQTATQDALSVGMVVRVEGTINPDGKTGVAKRIVFDEDLQGAIANLANDVNDASLKTFTLFGTEVQVSRTLTQYEDVTFETLANGQVLEISGYYNTDGILIATYIDQEKDSSESKIRGTVSKLNSDSTVFEINGQQIDYTNAQLDDDFVHSSLANGMQVEVEGQIVNAVLLASEVDLEESINEVFKHSSSDDFDIEGYIANYDENTQTFELRGVKVDASAVTLPKGYNNLADNVWVDVEGVYDRTTQTLLATEIEVRNSEIELDGQVLAVNLDGNGVGSFDLSIAGKSVTVNSGYETIFDRENSRSRSLATGEFVEVDAVQNAAGEIFALEIEIENGKASSVNADENEFQGIYQGAQGNEIKVSNLSFTVSTNARFENDNRSGPQTLAQFLAYDTNNSPALLVELEYDSNGLVTQIEVDDE